MSENSFHKLNRPDFVALKKQFVHPSSEVSERDQLIGRDQELELFRNALERRGNNIFVWGKRGVGKTSLAHTSINTFSEIVYLGPLLACENHTTKEGLFSDIIRRAKPSSGGPKTTKLALRTPIASIEREFRQLENIVGSINHATEILSSTFPQRYDPPRHAAIIIDEFDQLQNAETKTFLTALAKQMSVDDTPVKLIFCGVSEDLETLIGHHESVGRYITAIKLNPLSDDKIWEITNKIGSQFGVKLSRGQEVRVGQIACGYPTFAHLIMEEVLNVIYDRKISDNRVSQEIFNEAMRRAASGAATHLQGAYTTATQKGTDRYVEVLWAVADGPHISDRQFKDIFLSYKRIMESRERRNAITKEPLFRNHLNSLCKASHGNALEREKSGWYSFSDPMFRGYVRMIAYNDGVELGDESFSA